MNRLRDALSGLADLVVPLRCAGCGAVGTGWCRECEPHLRVLRRIERPLLESGPPVYSLGRYQESARRAVLAYKESGRRDLAEPFGQALASALRAVGDESDQRWSLIPAPSRAVASRRRGGPHLVRIGGRAVSALAGSGWSASVSDCLAMARGVRDSAGLDPAERVRNLAGRVLVRNGPFPPSETPIALIDDVITTGATVATCLHALESAGIGVTVVVGLTSTAG